MNKLEFLHPRDELVQMMQRIYDVGMTTVSGGNLSILDDNGDMWITPSGIDKGTLRREDICCVRADGTLEGIHRPSVEYPFHRAIYQACPGVRAVMHAHPPTLVAFSIAGVVPDTTANADVFRICGKVGFAAYAVPGSEELGKKISAEFAKGFQSVMLENHGAVVIADSMSNAFKKMETLDFFARSLGFAVRLGKPNSLSAAQLAAAQANHNPGFCEVKIAAHGSDEKELRRQLASYVKRCYRQKLFTSTSGTYAVRVDQDSFLITPADADRAWVDPEDLVLVRDRHFEAGKKPSRAANFCREVFAAHPEIKALTLSQPPHLMGYALTNAPFDPRLIPESYIVLREIPSFSFGAVYDEPDNVVAKLSPRYPVILVRNQFLVTSGRTMIEAYDRMEVAEYSAMAAITAAPLGEIKPINAAQVAEIVHDFKLIP